MAIGLALALIGLRFAVSPRAAARFFGIDAPASPAHLHAVIAARDVWLGLIVVALASLSDWRGMAIWLGLGAVVCVTDAAIVTNAGAPAFSIAFHLVSGALFGAVGWMSIAEHRRARPR